MVVVRGQLSFVILILFLHTFLAVPAAAEGVTIEVVHSFPVITEFDPPADPALEGSTEVRLFADGMVRVVGEVPWLIQDSTTEFHTVFAWNDTIARPLAFTDGDGDTISLLILPEPVMPLDLARHDIPVVHITTERANLWDPDIGIYVWGNYSNYLQRGIEWERPATMDYYEADGQLAFSEPVGLRINGSSSRAYYQKGLRIYFDDYGTSDTIEHDFFGEGIDPFERLVLRANRYPDFAISSAVNEPLHRDLGHPGSRHLSIAVYLNNEYWGLYSLRERLDSKFVETTRNWADDDYVLIKDNEVVEGDYADWENFLAPYSGPGPFDSHQFFQDTDSALDLDSYIDWIMLNTCGASADNMAGKNLALLKIGGQKWKYMAWDEDLLFQAGNRYADHLRFYSANTLAEFQDFQPPVWYSGGPWSFTFEWNNLLRSLMQNAEFKARLRHRGSDLLDGPLSVAAVNARIDSVAVHQGPEWVNHQERWGGTTTWYSSHVISFKSFVTGRTVIARDLLEDFLAFWAQPVELSSFSGERSGADIALAWHTEREEDCAGFLVERSVGEPGQFVTIASHETVPELVGQGQPDTPADYTFTDEAVPVDEDLFYRLTHVNFSGQPTVHDWVVTFAPDPTRDLRLNELLAANNTQGSDEMGEFDDWVEIYNSGVETVSLAGLFLTDNLDNPVKWAFPDTVIGPGEFMIIWCDEDLDQGPLHASFKLSAGGEELGLYSGYADGNQPLDTLVFPSQTDDVSLGRQVDGLDPWVYFSAPTPGWSNQHSSGVEWPEEGAAGSGFFLAPAAPNPADGPTSISFTIDGPETQQIELEVFDLRGRSVRLLARGSFDSGEHRYTWDRRDSTGRPAPSGIYFFRLKSGDHEFSRRVMLVR